MHDGEFDLAAAARQEMVHEGFDPDFPPGTDAQLAAVKARPAPAAMNGIRDLRHLQWSSIDNDTSRDLDQLEVAERVQAGIRVLIAIADVDSAVSSGTPIDGHAASQTTSVYTGIKTFPMLPEELSTDLTSLNEASDRLAMIVEMVVAGDGAIASSDIYRALVRNRAQLTYNAVGPWLEGTAGAPPKVTAQPELNSQIKLQDEAAQLLSRERHRLGALNIDRVEAEAILSGGRLQGINARGKNRATALIETFMIAANGVMAHTLLNAGAPSLRRVVKTPERWPRIVELAARYGETLPATADSGALNAFLERRRAADPVHFEDLSLAVVKLMGSGEYSFARPGDTNQGHFALAAHDYTHSTAPNRRFADLVTQRLMKCVLAGQAVPYSGEQLESIARNCTLRENAARKVERVMNKRIAAVALEHRIGETFAAVVTGVTPKGVFVRVLNPPVEGLLVRGQQGVDVGDQLKVKLVHTDPQLGHIDFAV
ncbi:RNB domain-containing ribonuclease [Paludibaculum fermentans]|uniref:RNB domain-containing ribonuclease n=1 Tax=Paludibaculum fermentans TaxID=1473598 RepID=A0A7S7NP08_PALFE|nr:RNB domain-containing ribonuclease [Paludibaculum fermentans]QOY86624.1 RNB domain-containing ribonuclease [Paludibaculum fermentans]